MLVAGDIEAEFHCLGIVHMCLHRNVFIAKQNISIIIIMVLFLGRLLKEAIRSRGNLRLRLAPQCHSWFRFLISFFWNGIVFALCFPLLFSVILIAFVSLNLWVLDFQLRTIFECFCFEFSTFIIIFESHSFKQAKNWFDVLKNQFKTVDFLWKSLWFYYLTIILQ